MSCNVAEDSYKPVKYRVQGKNELEENTEGE